jgi:hypothetical protein
VRLPSYQHVIGREHHAKAQSISGWPTALYTGVEAALGADPVPACRYASWHSHVLCSAVPRAWAEDSRDHPEAQATTQVEGRRSTVSALAAGPQLGCAFLFFICSHLRYSMLENDEEYAPPPLLACGHRWNGTEAWLDMVVIVKEQIDGPQGSQPAISTGHFCRACRAKITGERFGSLAEAEEWLRQALAAPVTPAHGANIRLRDLPSGGSTCSAPAIHAVR